MCTPNGTKSSLASSIYNWLSVSQQGQDNCWDGWKILWKLMTIPKVKVFLWRMLHRRTPTFAYLHMLTIGPDRECSFCGLEHEIDEHLLWRFQKSKLRWSVIGSFVGMDLEEINHFTGGEWLTRSWQTRCGKSSSRLLWP